MKNYFYIKPHISVVMCVYNGEETLANAIESILKQSYRDFELIIVDDASVDNTPRILTLYKDARIKILTNNENIGLTKSLNIGVKNSRGKIIARMDADDISTPDRLLTQVLEIRKGVDICSTRAIIEGTKRPRVSWLYWRIQLLFSNPFIHGSLMFTREIYNRIGGYDEDYKYAQDYIFIIAAIKNNARVCYLHSPKYILYVSPNSISARHNISQKKYALLARDDYRRYLLKKIKKIFTSIINISNFFDPIRHKILLSDVSTFENSKKAWLLKNNDCYYRKPLATRKALIVAYKYEKKNYIIYINYLLYRYLYFLNFLRIIAPFNLKIPDFSKIEADSICFTLGVDRAKPPINECQDLPFKNIEIYALRDLFIIIRMSMLTGIWEPYYHVSYLAYRRTMLLHQEKLKKVIYVCEDCGDMSAQILISNSFYFKSVEMYFSTLLTSLLVTKNKIYTNNKINYKLLSKLGNTVEFKNYDSRIFSGSFIQRKKNKFKLGIIMPLSSDKPLLYNEMISLLDKYSNCLTMFVSYHPQEQKIQNFEVVRDRMNVTDHEFVQSCCLFITTGSSLDDLVKNYSKKIIYIHGLEDFKNIKAELIEKFAIQSAS